MPFTTFPSEGPYSPAQLTSDLNTNFNDAQTQLNALDGRLDTAEPTLVSLDSRVDTLEGNVAALQAKATLSLPAENTTSFVVSNADLAGNVIRRVNSVSNQTVTVNSGLTGTEPFVVVRKGVGTVTFVAGVGVTINSVGGGLAIGNQYGAVTLIPEGADNYLLIGDV